MSNRTAVGEQSGANAEMRVRSLDQVLPDVAELSVAVGSPMRIYAIGRPGGLEVLSPARNKASPIECLGAACGGMRLTYQPVAVKAAIDAAWSTIDDGGERYPDPDFHIAASILPYTVASHAACHLLMG